MDLRVLKKRTIVQGFELLWETSAKREGLSVINAWDFKRLDGFNLLRDSDGASTSTDDSSQNLFVLGREIKEANIRERG